jgi:GNAT superfamily N-acetyltransferase
MQFHFPGHHSACRLVDLQGDDVAIDRLLSDCQDFFSRHHLAEGQTPSVHHLLQDLPASQQAQALRLGLLGPEGQLVGFALLVKDWQRARQWCLRVQVLHPDWRNQGLGTHLYEAITAWAKAQGAAAILIGVLASNDGARRFWQRLGFQEVRQDQHTSGELQVEMEHRFCDLPIDRVVQPGRTLARQWHERVLREVGTVPGAVPGRYV